VHLDLRLLLSFVAVADELHFGRAADHLGIAQPALSQQIRRMETQLGAELFVRDSRSVALTPAGAALLPEARGALDAVRRGVAAARAAADRRRMRLCLGVDLDVPRRVLRRVHATAAELTELDVRVVRQHQGDALAAMREGELDLVLGWARMPYGPPVRSQVVDGAEVVAVLRRDHPEAHRTTMPRDVFARHPFVMFAREPTADVFDWLVTNATGRQPEQLQIEQVASLDDGTSAMLRGAATGCGLTLAMRDGIDPDEHPELVAIPFAPPLLHEIKLIWAPAAESASVRAFVDRCAAVTVWTGTAGTSPMGSPRVSGPAKRSPVRPARPPQVRPEVEEPPATSAAATGGDP
jgi:DNA-binding transcriptional LysR family regulator